MIRAIGRVEMGESEGAEDSDEEGENKVERKPLESAGLIQL